MTNLQSVVDIISLESQTVGSLFFGKPRYLANRYAKIGMQQLNLTFGMHIKGMNINVPSSCRLYKPEGFERFIRAYILNCDGRTIEIDRNNKVPSELLSYLVDCDGTLLTDCNNEPLTQNCLSCNEDGSGCSDHACTECKGTGECCVPEWEQMLNDIMKHKNSWVKDNADFIEFSSDLEDVAVVVEFVTNQTVGVEECAIQVPDSYAMALEYYVKYRLLEGDAKTLQTAQYFYQKYKNIKAVEKANRNPLTTNDLYKTLFMN